MHDPRRRLSLNRYVDEIKENRANGVRLITLNGSYNWAIAHGLTPSAQVIVMREHSMHDSRSR